MLQRRSCRNGLNGPSVRGEAEELLLAVRTGILLSHYVPNRGIWLW
jgi:hypothetical protein